MNKLNYKLLDELPRDLKMEIQKYLMINQMYLTSKKNWKKYIKLRVSSILMSDLGLINYNTFNTYIRYLIRNKLDYPFKYVVTEAKINFKYFILMSQTPVYILNKNTQREQGKKAQAANIKAAKVSIKISHNEYRI